MRKICKYDPNHWLMQDDEKNLLLMNEQTNQIYDLQNNQPESSKREDFFVFKTDNYPGPIALDATPSKECREYHENSCIQIDVGNKTIHKRCGTPTSMET